ncbi:MULTISPECIES: hypothetical protein [unclassified Coleofasciculus]|nr:MULTISPECIES: hypothetical protein [unclassified Coleofasciculus]
MQSTRKSSDAEFSGVKSCQRYEKPSIRRKRKPPVSAYALIEDL